MYIPGGWESIILLEQRIYTIPNWRKQPSDNAHYVPCLVQDE